MKRTLLRSCLLVLLVTVAVAADAQPFSVTFVIDLRAEIAADRFHPETDKVGVRGGIVPLSWSESLLAADPDGDGLYEAVATYARAPFGGQAITYKYKIERPGHPYEGWEDGRNRQLFLEGATQRVSRIWNAPPDPIRISRVGTILRHPAFGSKHVSPRDVQVYLPPGYERESKRRYSVLYLHDGQNVFDGAEQGMEWQVDETAEALIAAGRIEPVLIVAVHNSSARTEDYTPWHVERKRSDGTIEKEGGKAGLYARFLIEELKPFIDRTYRTRRAAADTAVGGASFGGLVSLWLALEHPKVFGGALAVSPAAIWADDALVRQVEALRRRPSLRVWVDVGTAEGDDYIAAVHRLRDALLKKGWKAGSDFAFVEQEGGGHDEISWASRVEGMLLFLYGSARR